MTNAEIKTKQEMRGTVVSDACDKTVTVVVERYAKHPRYGKYIRTRKKFKVHDPENKSKVGDKVTIVPTRPISKDKHFEVKYA